MTDASSPLKKASVRSFTGIRMSVPAAEGGQDYDDILGFPGDGFKDKDDTNPPETLLSPGNRLWMVVTQK